MGVRCRHVRYADAQLLQIWSMTPRVRAVTHAPDDPPANPPPASAPCLAGELDASGHVRVDAAQAREVARWRKAERERLITRRMALPMAERVAAAASIGEQVEALLGELAAPVVSVYWPIRAEPDLRPWMARLHAQGVAVALPVVVAPGTALEFRRWTPGCRMEPGVWRIPQPADRVLVTPSVTLAPLVGFDRAAYRLGYGGGYFDRTLAALTPQPIAIGVGYQALALETIFPQPFDIPMDWILTGEGHPVPRPGLGR